MGKIYVRAMALTPRRLGVLQTPANDQIGPSSWPRRSLSKVRLLNLLSQYFSCAFCSLYKLLPICYLSIDTSGPLGVGMCRSDSFQVVDKIEFQNFIRCL